MLALAGAAACAAAVRVAASELPLQTIARAEVRAEADAGWQPVRLPDTWGRRGESTLGNASYRLAFDLPAVPSEPLALMFTRLSTDHRVWLNERLLASDEQGPSASNRGQPAPVLIDMPPAMLQAGRNTVTVEVHYRMRAGLSEAVVGPAALLRERHEGLLLRQVALPQALNLAAAGLASFMLLIWWRRRSEAALGSFGALSLVGALRNYGYLLHSTAMPYWLHDGLFYAAQVTTTLLFGLFAQAFAARRSRRYTQVLYGFGGLLLLLAVAALWTDRMQWLRRVSYPLLLVAVLPGLWLMIERARRASSRAIVGVLLGVLAIVAASVHDYAFQAGLLAVTEVFWLPYAMPVALACFSWLLLSHLVGALAEVEALNTALESRVAARTHELELANLAKTRFLAAASHDLRQPVAAIGLLIGLVRERVAAPEVRGLLDKAHQSVASLEDLLRGLLDLSRLDAGGAQRSDAVALDELFAAIDLHEQAAAQAKGLRLTLRRSGLAVRSDPVLLEQILRNLVGNAVRYTDRGGVLVGARRRGSDRVLLQVWDSGRGIAPAHQAEVFEEFVQLGGPPRDGAQGLGLGLAIVRRAAARLGHPLALRSVPGRGSCFSLELPLERRARVPAAAARPPALPLAGRRIWLLDDDPVIRLALQERVAQWGAQVQSFADLGALDRALGGDDPRPDALLTDHRLPDGSGLDAIARARARLGAALPAVVVTGDTAPAVLRLLAQAGVPVLHKPFPAELLLAALTGSAGARPAAA